MTDLAVFARIHPRPEHRAEARAALEGILARTRAEPGCRQFTLHEGADGDPALYLYEIWDGPAALEAHHAQGYTRAVFAAYETWLAEPVAITKLARID